MGPSHLITQCPHQQPNVNAASASAASSIEKKKKKKQNTIFSTKSQSI